MDRKTIYEAFAYTGNKESLVALAETVGYDVLAGLMEDEFFTSYINQHAGPAEKTAAAKKRMYALSKSSLSRLLAIYFSDNENVHSFYLSLSFSLKYVLGLCARNYVVSTRDFSSTIRNEMLVKDRYGYSETLSPQYGLFFNYKREYGYFSSRDGFLLTLNGRAKVLLQDYFSSDIQISPSLQPDSHWRIFAVKNDIFKTIENCRILIKRDSLTAGIMPQLSVCKKLAPVAGIDEIFPGGNKAWKCWRTATLIMTLSATMKTVYPEESLRKAVNWLLSTDRRRYLLNGKDYFYPHLKGFNRSCLPNHGEIVNLTLRTLSDFSGKKGCWLPFEEFMMHLRSIARDDSEFLGYHESEYYADVQKVGTFDNILYPLLYRYLTEPVVKSVFFLLASFGLADLVIDDEDKCVYSGYDPIRGLRLTSLGSYILGFSDSYETASSVCNQYEVFDDRLVVRVKSGTEEAQGILTDVMEDLGGGRFVMTEASFLKNCRSGVEIDMKIDFFKSMVSPRKELPKIWHDFFASVKAKSGGLTECDMAGYVLYSIDPSREDLLRIFSTDSYILNHSFKVEGYRILIEKSAFAPILTKLRSMGYLIER